MLVDKSRSDYFITWSQFSGLGVAVVNTVVVLIFIHVLISYFDEIFFVVFRWCLYSSLPNTKCDAANWYQQTYQSNGFLTTINAIHHMQPSAPWTAMPSIAATCCSGRHVTTVLVLNTTFPIYPNLHALILNLKCQHFWKLGSQLFRVPASGAAIRIDSFWWKCGREVPHNVRKFIWVFHLTSQHFVQVKIRIVLQQIRTKFYSQKCFAMHMPHTLCIFFDFCIHGEGNASGELQVKRTHFREIRCSTAQYLPVVRCVHVYTL